MNRRNFIKAFTAVTASVPLATTLANASGAEKVIKTFQLGDIKKEVVDLNALGATNMNVSLKDEYGNNMTRGNIARIPVLAYNHEQYTNFVHGSSYSRRMLLEGSFYVSSHEQLFGLMRRTNIIGLNDYWETKHDLHNIMAMTYAREMIILNPQQYFRQARSF